MRRFAQRAGLVVLLVGASLWAAPAALARVHVGIGIAVPGVSIGVGNCWNCGYWGAPPVYYPPVYAAPVYYPAPYYPAPAYYRYGYGYGYYAPYYRSRRYVGHGYYRGGHYGRRGHGSYYRHGRR